MAYCGQATTENAKYLSSKTGLDPNVALAWLKNECQSRPNPTNPLNILYGATRGRIKQEGSRFASYTSTKAGLDDAAWLVNNSSYYGGIRAAIHTGNPALQARAIEKSPWAGGHYGGANQPGGISRTWEKVTGTKIDWSKISGAITGATSGGVTGAATFIGAGAAPPLKAWGDLVSFPTGHILTSTDVDAIMRQLRTGGFFANDVAGPFGDEGSGARHTRMILTANVGKAWTKSLQDDLQIQFQAEATRVAKSLDLPGQIIGGATRIATYLIAVTIILFGFWLYSKGQAIKIQNVELPRV